MIDAMSNTAATRLLEELGEFGRQNDERHSEQWRIFRGSRGGGEHQPQHAARVHGAASRFALTYGVVFSAADRADQQRLADELREQLTADGFLEESAQGAMLSLEKSIAEALSEHTAHVGCRRGWHRRPGRR
jgi:hypothetical protein